MPNAYQRRKLSRALKAQASRSVASYNNLMEIDALCRRYEDAFWKLHNVRLRVSYSHGWYYIGVTRVRQTILTQLTDLLLAKLHERELEHAELF